MDFVFIKGILVKVSGKVFLKHLQFWRRLLESYWCILAILPLLRTVWRLPSECHLQISALELAGRKVQVCSFFPCPAPVNHCSVFSPCDFIFSINGFYINGIMQYVPFCVGLFSLSTVLLKFIHVVECNIFFFFFFNLSYFHLSGVWWRRGRGDQR